MGNRLSYGCIYKVGRKKIGVQTLESIGESLASIKIRYITKTYNR